MNLKQKIKSSAAIMVAGTFILSGCATASMGGSSSSSAPPPPPPEKKEEEKKKDEGSGTEILKIQELQES